MDLLRTRVPVISLILHGQIAYAGASEHPEKMQGKPCCSSILMAFPNGEIASTSKVPDSVAVSVSDAANSVTPVPPLGQLSTKALKNGLAKTGSAASAFGMVKTTVRVNARRIPQDSTEGFEICVALSWGQLYTTPL